MSWLAEQAAILASVEPDPATYCAHDEHKAMLTPIELAPWVPARQMWIFDPEAYRDTHGYCCGDDDVSRTLALYGRWEPAGTEVFVRALNNSTSKLVIDFGCQLGWYSLIALGKGRDVLAIDAVPEHLRLLADSAHRLLEDQTDFDTQLYTVLHWVQGDSPILKPGPEIAIAKIDLEGNDSFAVDILSDVIDEGLLEHLMIEVSPCFNDSYFDLLTWLLQDGAYTAAVIDPWRPFTRAEINRVIDDMPQFDVILARKPWW